MAWANGIQSLIRGLVQPMGGLDHRLAALLIDTGGGDKLAHRSAERVLDLQHGDADSSRGCPALREVVL